MKKKNSNTKDLATLVFKKLKGARVHSPIPTEEILNILFENLFYSSIKTEESDFIKVTITLINSKIPDPVPPKRIVKDRWEYIRFDESIEFNVKNIVKLSKAADPWSASLAVDFNAKNEIVIWGMIDQAVHYQSFLHYEAESGPEQPGLFQTSITGIGSLVVIFDYELIATLKQNVLISNYLNVFNRGPVHEMLKSHTINYLNEVRLFVNSEVDGEDVTFWEQYLFGIWTEALSRILIRIQSYQHGGAFIITNNFESDLDIKHKIKYDRLFTSICNLAKVTIDNHSYSNFIQAKYMDEGNDFLPMDLYLGESVSDFTKREHSDELKGAIRFIASLSCIDGLVVFDTDLKVKGFGTVIKNIELPEYVYLSKSPSPSANNILSVDPNSFGTRHRSMFSFCWKNPESLGFVVSQDGDIRVIARVVDKLIMWENIKVQQLLKSTYLKRVIKKKPVTTDSNHGIDSEPSL
jgi:hypothetical protein